MKVGINWFKKYIVVGLAVIVGLSVFFGFGVSRVIFDYDFEKFFPINDEETSFFLEHRKMFESDNDFLLVAVEREKGVFDQSFLEKIKSFTQELEKKTPYVKSVSSLTNTSEQFIFVNGATDSRPYIDFEQLDLKRDSIRIFKSKELVNSLIARDAKSVGIYIRHEDYISKKKSDELIDVVQQIADNYHFENVRIAGRTIGQKFYIEKMVNEMLFFVMLSALLIVVFLFISFRSAWGVIIPQFVIVLSVVWVIGGMGWTKEPINIVLITLPSIMFVVAMSDVIHLVSRYLDALRQKMSKWEAIKKTIYEVGFATFLTSLTTAIGFFSLYFVSVQPIQVFGIVTGIGVLIAFLLTFLLLPILFYIFPSPKYITEKEKQSVWIPMLSVGFRWVIQKPFKILIIYSVLLLLFIVGVTMINTNNFLMDDISPKEQLKVDFNYLDEHYSGVRPFELAVELRDSSLTFWDLEVLNELDSVEHYLESEFGVVIKNSLIQTLKIINRSSHAGNVHYFKLPESKREIRKARRIVKTIGKGEYIHSILDSTERYLRISGALGDIGNNEVSAKNKKLNEYLNKHFSNGPLKYTITGTAHLFDKNIRYLSTSLIKGLSISILLVALIMGLVYRSFSMMIISIIPNVIPLIAIAAFMGWVGIELKTSTAIIFTIAFGIAVDDTIHFLGKFKFELMKGRTKLYALKRAYLTTGKAMVLTTLILCSGFLLLVFSSFMGTFYMGLMLCITLFIAVIVDLTLLPILLLLFYKPKPK